MDVYLSEQEQIQKIKDWWKKYGTSVLVALVVFAGATFGWRYWHKYETKKSEAASVIYEQMMSSDLSNNDNDFQLYAQHLIKDYKHTPYASLAALMQAGEAVENKKLDAAQTSLQWVIDNSGNKSFREIARIRKARVLVSLNQPQQALQILQKTDDASYQSLADEVTGDAYLLMNKKDKALKAYQNAIKNSTAGINTAILTMKVNLLKH